MTVALPESRAEDDEDVVWGLSTASALWARGERRDAIVWLRRAADAAVAAGQDFRGSELGMYASELEDVLGAAELEPESAAIEGAAAAISATDAASPEAIELLDIDVDRPSQISIDLEDELPTHPGTPPPPGRIALTPGPVPPPRSAFPPPGPLPAVAAPPRSAVPASSAPPPPISAAPPLEASAPPVVIPLPARVGIAAPHDAAPSVPHSFEQTPMPATPVLRAGPTSSRRMTPTPPRKSQPRGPILDPWADEPTDPASSPVRPTVSFRQSDGGGDELVLPRRSSTRAGDADDEVVTSAAPLDTSLGKKVEPRAPRKVVRTQPSATAPGQLAQAAAIVPSKGLSVPPPPATPIASAPKAPPPVPPSSKANVAAASAPPIETLPAAPIAPVESAHPVAVKPPPPIAPPPASTAKPSVPPATPWPTPAAARPSTPPAPAPTIPKPATLSAPVATVALVSPTVAAATLTAATVAAPTVAAPTVAPATIAAAPPSAPVAAAPASAPAQRITIPPPPAVAGAPKLSFPLPPPVPSAVPKSSVAPAAPAPAKASVAPAAPAKASVAPAAPPPPSAKSNPPAAPVRLDGVALDEVDAFVDLPPEMQQRLVALARIEALSADEEVSSFGAALLLAGEASVCATIVDTPACRAVMGTLVPSRGSLAEPVGVRVVAGSQGARVAIWEQPVIEEALASCPWVLDELVSRANRIQALAGATMGPLGEIDEASRGELLDRLTVHFAQPFESLVDAGDATLGIAIVGGGVVELGPSGDASANTLHPGELLFARAVLEGRAAPRSAHAGASGALVLIGEARLASELMASSPPLAALFGDASE